MQYSTYEHSYEHYYNYYTAEADQQTETGIARRRSISPDYIRIWLEPPFLFHLMAKCITVSPFTENTLLIEVEAHSNTTHNQETYEPEGQEKW